MELHISLPLYFVAINLLTFGEFLNLSPPANLFSDCPDCIRFPPNGSSYSLNNVKIFLIDKNHSTIIVGARDALYKLDLSLKLAKQGDIANLTPSVDALKACSPANKEDCHNFIKLLLFNSSGSIFVCGTYARERGCWSFSRTGALQPFRYKGNTDLFTPRGKNQNITGLFAGNLLFTGLNTGDNLRMSRFSHSNIQGQRDIITTIEKEVVFRDANFVSSFLSDDNFIYIFLRETAVEDQSKSIYSRVARVCLHDAGVPSILPQKFSSFTKIRLSCSVPGNVPFNYDELQATYLSVNSKGADGYIYGIFSTPELGILGSAVCVYSFKEIQGLFANSKYLEKDKWGWKQVPSYNPDAGRPQCNSQLKTTQYGVDTAVFAKEHALLSGIAEPESGKPLFIKHNVRFTQLVADKVSVSGEETVYVIFIGTDNGTVYKVFSDMSKSGTSFVVEQIQVFKKPEPIYSMKIYKGYVYIGSLSHVVRMPVERCGQYKSCRTCVSSRDPYCGWSGVKCVTKTTAGNSAWKQDITNGNFANICPSEHARCSLTITQSRPGGTSILLCQAEGIPIPSITSWEKNSLSIKRSSRISRKPGPYPGSELLVISRSGVQHMGLYRCKVSNKIGENSCSVNYTGGLPVIQYSGLVKINLTSYFSCRVEGIPKPRVVIYQITESEKKLINSHKTPLTETQGDRSYYCVAQNAFGPVVGKALTFRERDIEAELRLTGETWRSEFQDSNSKGYRILSASVKTAVQQTYSRNPAFLGLNKISFSEGSVVAEMTLRFAAQYSDPQVALLEDLQKAVSSGKVSNLDVDKEHVVDVKPDTTESTHEPRKSSGLDSGLFAAGVITAIVFSILVGFFLGVKFHSQATGRCRSGTPGAYAVDAHSPKTVIGTSFLRSPPRNDADPQGRQSQRKLVNHTSNGAEPNVDEDEDSDVSMSGKFTLNERTVSPTLNPPERRAPLANGEVVHV